MIESTLISKEGPYNPSSVETRIYEFWNSSGFFTPTIDKSKDPFVMIMPPPNVTGELHMGHALTFAIEDMIVRWHRMKGEPTLFLPGTDHAGIATQVVVERLLASEGKNRHDLGRENFEKRIWEWVDQYGDRIYNQLRRLGTSCDWSRKSFTLDEGPQKAVRKTFVDLYKKDLIYRGERITSWCPRCSTALSDLEVKYKDIEGYIYEIYYPLEGSSDKVLIATTRPETMFGDSAVAVNPNDNRYENFVGKSIKLPLTERVIPIIADDAVEVEFGTGALKVTPAHDPVDFEIGIRHNLDTNIVFTLDGFMTSDLDSKFAGLDRLECRQKAIDSLSELNLMGDIKPFNHSVAHCDRCDEVIEPMITKQWYVAMETIAEPARKAVRSKDIEIIPKRFEKIYFDWMDNIRDWPVSRQLWWGHQLPVWYCNSCPKEIVEYNDPTTCPSCGSDQLSRDPDVLDTWFSSGLWPHSTLGWPDQTDELDYFYPGSVMETGYDILFFWVARMIMMGIENMGEVPFKTIYLHGLVLDPEGIKMSKTKGNVLDPLEIINEYGADALRFALTTGTAAGNNIRMSESRLESSRNFANKIWNASRFVLSLNPKGNETPSLPKASHIHDKWIISRLNIVAANVNKHMESYQFGEAQQELYDFFWNEYCDWFIELSKIRITKEGDSTPIPTLLYVLDRTLKLLHPFMPFVTEEIWTGLFKSNPNDSLMVREYPECIDEACDSNAINSMNHIFEIVKGIRNAKAELNIKSSQYLKAIMVVDKNIESVRFNSVFITNLTNVEIDVYDSSFDFKLDTNIPIITSSATTYLEIGNVIDTDSESNRLSDELKTLSNRIKSLESRLSNTKFTENAPKNVVEEEKDRLSDFRDRESKLNQLIAQLRN
ncbi:MAG: valine--tRNA ligase [Chloroflexi bacterium]|nr:valine--tRNA ligase [Chloroflexota bacterium]